MKKHLRQQKMLGNHRGKLFSEKKQMKILLKYPAPPAPSPRIFAPKPLIYAPQT